MRARAKLVFFLVILTVSLLMTGAFGKVIPVTGRMVVDDGDVLSVRGGDELVIEGVLVVKGVLRIEGDEVGPAVVKIKGNVPFGIEVRGGEVRGKRFRLVGTGGGLTTYGGTVDLDDGSISAGRVAINGGGESNIDLENIRFEGGKAALVVRGDCGATVKKCWFDGVEKGAIFVQDRGKLEVVSSAFAGCAVGIKFSMSGVNGKVSGSVFRGSGKALLVEKRAGPLVMNCRFEGNETAVFFTKRGAGRFEKNVFENNGISVYLEYSSYPLFRRNDFLGAKTHFVFVRNQSATWEREATAADREGDLGYSAVRSTKREVRLPDSVLTGKIDFRENYWGYLTKEMTEGRMNVSGIVDGMDRPYFEYKGKKYPLDVVDFSGFSVKPFTGER